VSASRPSLDDVYLHYAGRSFERADAPSHGAPASDQDQTGPAQKGEAA
jgi:hypothetical protein